MIKSTTLWTLFAFLFTGIGYFLFEADIFTMIYHGDFTNISFGIIILFLYQYVRLGLDLLDYEHGEPITEKTVDIGFEMSDNVMTLGMIGTVMGFIHMTASFTGVDFSDIANIQELFVLATTGMSTALYTTLAGLIAHIILRCSYFAVSVHLKEDYDEAA